jgi:N-acetylglucosamine-6-phosphate deacetylase
MKVQGISVYTGTPVEIEIRGGEIHRVNPLPPGPQLPFVSCGFLDLQVNGYGRRDYSLEDLAEEDVAAIVRSLDPSGTTRHLPTVITSPKERIVRSLRVISRAIRGSADTAAAIAGFHIEGPFISPEDGPRGAHDQAYVRPPDLEEFREWQEAAEGRIRIVTLAPEWPQALRFIESISAEGIVAAIGHTGAEPERIREAVAAGARMSTHLGNGSHHLLPRLRNYIWEQLAEDRLAAGLISDGFHLPPAVVKAFARAKGLERLVLVSDVAYLAGLPPGRYRRERIEIEIFGDGHMGLPGTGTLAGAAHLLDWDIPRFMAFTGCRLAEAIPLCTSRPAALLGLPAGHGRLEAGSPADLVLFEHRPGDERLRVLQTIRGGRPVYAISR